MKFYPWFPKSFWNVKDYGRKRCIIPSTMRGQPVRRDRKFSVAIVSQTSFCYLTRIIITLPVYSCFWPDTIDVDWLNTTECELLLILHLRRFSTLHTWLKRSASGTIIWQKQNMLAKRWFLAGALCRDILTDLILHLIL